MERKKLVNLIKESLEDGKEYTANKMLNKIYRKAVEKITGEVNITKQELYEFLLDMSENGIITHKVQNSKINTFSKK